MKTRMNEYKTTSKDGVKFSKRKKKIINEEIEEKGISKQNRKYFE